jgi:Ca-activated chloride channel family protein
MQAFFQNFHFLRPLWLLVIPLLWAVIFWSSRKSISNSAWSKVIDAALLPSLQLTQSQEGDQKKFWAIICLMWTLCCLALAGPSWQKTLSNAYRSPSAWVMVLDLSSSMEDTDVKPSRATRARYAMNDILDAAGENRVGLVIFSDEAYTVVPLTDDVANIRGLLQSLTPEIMPSQGNQLTPALVKASALLTAIPANKKQIIVLSDGVEDNASAIQMAKNLHAEGIDLYVVAIANEGAISANENSNQSILKETAVSNGGKYVNLSQLPSLISQLKESALPSANSQLRKNIKLEKWLDSGVWLLPIILLLAALLGRRGWL